MRYASHGLRRYRLDSLPSPGTAGAEEEGEWVVFLGDQFPLAQEDGGQQPPAGQPAVQLDAEVRTVVSGGWRGWVRRHMQSGDASDSAASGEPEPRALALYRRLPADQGPRVRSMVAVVARLRVGRGRAVQLESADADYLSPAELAASIPDDADWGGVDAGAEGGAYLLLSQAGAERSLAVEPDVLAEAEAALRGAEDETDPSDGLAGLSTAYCLLLSEPGLSDPESSAGELLSSGAGWEMDPAIAAEVKAIEMRAAALDRRAESEWAEYRLD